MNKKQLIVAWIIGIIISLICLHPPTYRYYHQGWITRVDVTRTALYIIPILILGILLIITLRNDDLAKQIKEIFVKIKEFLKAKSRLIYKWVNLIGIVSIGLSILSFVLYGIFRVYITPELNYFLFTSFWDYLSYLIFCYLIYLIVKLIVWVIKERIYTRKVNKAIIIREGLIIFGCVILVGISSIFLRFDKPHYESDWVDWDNAIPITKGGADIKLMGKAGVDKFLHRDTGGMSDQQIITEINRILDNGARKEKIIRVWYKTFSILWIIGLLFYPTYLLFRLIIWERKTLKQRPV